MLKIILHLLCIYIMNADGSNVVRLNTGTEHPWDCEGEKNNPSSRQPPEAPLRGASRGAIASIPVQATRSDRALPASLHV